MHVFVTGATGWVGSAIVDELVAAGHQVTGLVRSDEKAAELVAAGGRPFRATLDNLDALYVAASAADAVIHTAFNHDFSRFQASCEADRHIIAALGSALAGSDRPLVITSGIGVLPSGGLLNERTDPASGPGAHPRAATEEAAQGTLAQGVRTTVVRLPPSVHGEGDHGFVPLLIGIARAKATAAYVGEGRNRWPAVHRLDAARLYVEVLERGTAGARYHAVGEEGVAFRDIAGAIGGGLDLPVLSVPADKAAEHFGWFAHFAAMDVPASSAWTREQLGWEPSGTTLLADMEGAGYFKA